MKVSIFNNFHTPVEDKDFLALIERIKSTEFQEQINSIRYAYHQGETSLGDRIKKELPAFTPSGIFTDGRTKEHISEYSQMAHVDIDKLELEEVEGLRKIINECSYTYASFVSPSGKGLKVFVRIDSAKENHQEMITQLMQFYNELTGVECDAHCTDINRLCFFSHDESAFVNTESETFKPLLMEEFKEIKEDVPQTDKSIEHCIEFTEKISQYEKGNRNAHVYLIARNGNRFGIPQDEVEQYCLNTFDLPQNEIRSSISSAYKHNLAEAAKFANLAKDKIGKVQDENNDLLYNTPKIPISVHESLPNILKEGSRVFEVHREKDVFLTTAITILSGCLPNVSGVYAQRTIYPNLFCFVLAPPASGKGSMQSSKELADVYHDAVKMNSVELKKAFDQKMREYKRKNSAVNKKNAIEIEDEEPPEAPPFKVVYIPANTSSAKLYQHLEQNDEKGIICETEADTLGNVFKNDWGSYSDLLRKAFQHEKISLSRKGENEYIDINNPRISVALTGTPGQIFNIIPNAEDGLFSRFIFYAFRSDAGWISPAPNLDRVNLTEHFKNLSKSVYDMVQFLEQYPTTIELSTEQWQKLNDAFTVYLDDIIEFAGQEATSLIKRMGIVLYRFCMAFTAMRKFDNGDTGENTICTDDDFENARILVDTFIQHSILMFANLPTQSNIQGITKSPKKQQFFEALPQSFQRKIAIEIGVGMGMKERTIDGCLKSWIGQLIQKLDTGLYEKIRTT